MTNKDLQKELDERKWIASEMTGYDMSGDMPYCDKCDKQTDKKCSKTQEDRELNCLCAKAYRRRK